MIELMVTLWRLSFVPRIIFDINPSALKSVSQFYFFKKESNVSREIILDRITSNFNVIPLKFVLNQFCHKHQLEKYIKYLKKQKKLTKKKIALKVANFWYLKLRSKNLMRNGINFCNLFQTNVLFLYHLKTSENLWFSRSSDVFREYRNGTLA